MRAALLLPLVLLTHGLRHLHTTTVYQQHSEGYQTVRIPSLVAAGNNTLLAFAEGRVALDRAPVGNTTVCWGVAASLFDWKCLDKDIVVKSSFDGGASFTALRTIASGNSSFFYSNPLGLVDRDTGIVWLAYTRCPVTDNPLHNLTAFVNCSTMLRSSRDHGASWGDACDVPGTYPQGDGGIGAGIQLTGEAHRGRLLFTRNGHGTLYSDDGGTTWHLGHASSHQGESQAVELSTGTVVMEMRFVNSTKYDYLWGHSRDGGRSFSHYEVRDTPLVPDCPTSVIVAGASVLMSHPNSHVLPRPYGRRNMTVSSSRDNGNTWADEAQVYAGPSAYSSLAVLPDARVGLLFEASQDNQYPIDFQSILLATLEL